MAASVLAEILRWSGERPAWQQDALRRIFLSGALTGKDIADLVEIVKATHGLSDPRPAVPLDSSHVAAGANAAPVRIVRVTHHEGVNALASEQTLSFGPALTVVYGNNAAGKSGYTRILKQACRSRSSEGVIGNVLATTPPVTPRATILVQEGSVEEPFAWTPKAPPSETLAAVSIFDSHCAPVYLREKTDVAFRPFGLDVFDKLSSVCTEVRSALEKERALLTSIGDAKIELPEGTSARKLLDSLTSLTSPERVRAVATLSAEEEERLRTLLSLQRDFDADDPRRRGRDLALRAERLQGLVAHLQDLFSRWNDAALDELRLIRQDAADAQTRLTKLRAGVATPDLLPGTGGSEWMAQWAAAKEYGVVAYPGQAFPHTDEGARCILCQQVLDREAANRLRSLASFAASDAQAQADEKARLLCDAQRKVAAEAVPTTLAAARDDLAQEDTAAAVVVEAVLEAASLVRVAIIGWVQGDGVLPAGMTEPPTECVLAVVAGLQSRARELQNSPAGMTPEMRMELKDLLARRELRANLQVVLDAIERKKRIAAYSQCLDEVTTNAITKKSTELTKALVTDALRTRFAAELQEIGFTHLDVEVQPAGGSKGALFHKLVFTHAPTVSVPDVLSEGEARALSVAAFMTELSTAPAASAIVFDDPVSSLDHVWRERIARRLVAESNIRQTVVFTHDVLFLHFLMTEADRQGVALLHQCIRRDAQAGVCVPDLPWVGLRIKERLGVLKARQQAADKTFRTQPERYESEARELYGLLREAWEQAVGEVLLNDVIGRYRPSIETNKALKLHDISTDDCRALEEGMTKCSRWIRGHDAPPADGTPIPKPSEIGADIAKLDTWVAAIRKRRQ